MAASDDGPSTGARGAQLRDGGRETLDEHLARSNAMRNEATTERGAGASRPDPRDPTVRGQDGRSNSVDGSVLAAFTQDLLAGTEVGEMDGGVDVAEDGMEVEVAEEAPVQERRAKKPRSARAPRVAHGGVEDGEDAAADEPDPPPAGPSRSKKWPRVSAKKRVRVLDLDSLMLIGGELGVLVGWQAETVPGLVQRLPSRGFHLLWRASERLPSSAHKVVLLQALAAHRPVDDFEPLADALLHGDEGDVLAWLADRAEERDPFTREEPGPAPAADVLQRHYDPCHFWLEEPTTEVEADEDWPVPQWLRGATREPLELCAVAFLQAARGVFADEEVDDEVEGASDPLAAALELHGDAHPAVARWGVTLAARADSHQGLLNAAQALLRARESVPTR